MVSFQTFTYETDETPSIRCLIKATLEAQQFVNDQGNGNFPTNQPPNLLLFARSNPERSGNGIHARGIAVKWDGPPAPGYAEGTKLFIPIFRLPTYRILKVGQRGTYLDGPVIIVSKRPEVMRS